MEEDNNNEENDFQEESSHKKVREDKGAREVEKSLIDKARQNPWMVSTIGLAVLVIVMFVVNFGGVTGNVVSEDVAGENLVEYLNTIADSEVTLVDVQDLGNMYLVTVEYQDQEVPV